MIEAIKRVLNGSYSPSDEFLILFLIIAIPTIIGCIAWLLCTFYNTYKVGVGVAIFLGLILIFGWFYFLLNH